MAKKSINLFANVTNAKTRTFVILFGAIIVIGIAVAITRSRSSANQDPLSKQGSQAVAVPNSIQSTPGSIVSEQYRELQIAENDRRAQDALKKKTSAIPTIIGAISENSQTGSDQSLNSLESALKDGQKGQGQGNSLGTNAGFAGTDAFGNAGGPGGVGGPGGTEGLGGRPGGANGIGGAGSGQGLGGNAGANAGGNNPFGTGGLGGNAGLGGLGGLGGGKSPQEIAREEQEAKIREQRDRLDKMREEKEAQKRREQELKAQQMQEEQERKVYEASVQKMAGQMKGYAQGAYNEWSKFPVQVFVQGDLATKKQSSQKDEKAAGSNKNEPHGTETKSKAQAGPSGIQKSKSIIKAGTVLFGIMDTAVNSDENGPILATVVSGKYQGSKLIGSFQHGGQQEAIVVSFTQMSIPKATNSFSVQAIAIDPDTARTALASDVDRHYLLRYGSLFASAFLTGYANAIQQQGSTTTTSPLTGATTTSYPPLDNRQIFLSALGQVGTQWGQATRTYFNTPYTVTVDQGTAIGVLFLSDIDVSAKDYK